MEEEQVAVEEQNENISTEINDDTDVTTEINDETGIDKKETSEKSLKPYSDKDVSFIFRMIVAVIFGVLSSLFIKPAENSSALYKIYFFVYICFEAFALYCCFVTQKNILDLSKFYTQINLSKGRYSGLKSGKPKINDICKAYKESFLVSGDENYHKTRANSDLYFGSEAWMQDMNILPVQVFLKIIPGSFIGFGILGTFIGFAGGLIGLKGTLTSPDTLMVGVQVLLDGLGNAFNTSIVGVIASMFLNYIMIHPLFNKMDSTSKKLCDYLDKQFYVTEVDAMATVDENNNLKPFPVVLTDILAKLESVSSNINYIGVNVGAQVTKSVKENLDKTIEKIIKAEIEKLKEEINSSINLLKECATHLQNAPQHLKEAAINMENSAKDSVELFKVQSIASIQTLTKTINTELNSKFDSYVKNVEGLCEEMVKIKNVLASMPDDFKSVNTSVNSAVENFSSNQQNFANAISESASVFYKSTEISNALSKTYEEHSSKIEQIVSIFTDVLNEYKETSKESKELLSGFKGMDEQIAKIFDQINENTQSYGKIVGESLANYLKGFQDATKDISKQFAEATFALSEEVSKLNATKI